MPHLANSLHEPQVIGYIERGRNLQPENNQSSKSLGGHAGHRPNAVNAAEHKRLLQILAANRSMPNNLPVLSNESGCW